MSASASVDKTAQWQARLADIRARAEANRQRWLAEGARQFGAGDLAAAERPTPIVITCGMGGDVQSVAFGPAGRAGQDVHALEQLLRAAIAHVRFCPPSVDTAQTRSELIEARHRQTDQTIAWLDNLTGSDAAASVRTAVSDGGEVSVAYRGIRLTDIRVLQRDWSVFATPGQIEAVIVRASRIALGLEHPGIIGGMRPTDPPRPPGGWYRGF